MHKTGIIKFLFGPVSDVQSRKVINNLFSPFFSKDWFQFSKGLKEGFKANYNERACPVREYTYVSRSDSESSDSSGLSVATNQTDCSVSIAVNEPEDLSVPFVSSTVSPEENQQITV